MQPPLQAPNLGSAAEDAVSLDRDELYRRMDMETLSLALRIPLFLANPRQMDLLAPPWQLEEPDSPVVGLYVRKKPEGKKLEKFLSLGENHLEKKALEFFCNLHPQTPFILICPERAIEWACKTGASFELIFDKVFYHELGHGRMDSAPEPNALWAHTIEESLANGWSLRLFEGTEKAWVLRLIPGQPKPYRGVMYLVKPTFWEALGREGRIEAIKEFLPGSWFNGFDYKELLRRMAEAWYRSKPFLKANSRITEFWQALGERLLEAVRANLP